jgi:hypothetical protein
VIFYCNMHPLLAVYILLPPLNPSPRAGAAGF